MRAFVLVLSLAACADDAGTCPAAELDAGTAEAEVDGAAWSGDGATWVWSGSSLQLNTETTGDWRLGLILQTTADGTALKDAVDAGGLPLEVSLHDGEGAWALVTPASGDSFSTNEGAGGSLTLASTTDGAVTACFDFTAAGDDGSSVAFAGGAIHALELDL